MRKKPRLLYMVTEDNQGVQMKKVIAIFGAGPGLGASIAERFGREGYAVALIARGQDKLERLTSELEGHGVTAAPFVADLGQLNTIPSLIERVRSTLGRIDAICYAPATTEAFLPASQMTVEMMQTRIDYLFMGLVAAVNEVLADFRKNGGGAVLAGFGGSASQGVPFMSGPAPAQSAARNYLMSLHGELAQENIHVGMVTLSGVIQGSAYHSSVENGDSDAPTDFEMPLIDPAQLADQLWAVACGRGKVEYFFP